MSSYKMILNVMVEINEECNEEDKNTVLADKTEACKIAEGLLQDHFSDGKIMVKSVSFKRVKGKRNEK